ncbi:MAG: radical SAM/Cys-rich domain protein [Proteobacteria bacterium]|nr:radical SAM/Cys-rich domain protein [Pseudomonadota bacterium]
MLDFQTTLRDAGLPPLEAAELTWLQINVGKLCNQACHHCHVDAGPRRTEQMTGETADELIRLMEATPRLDLVDLTGGAPEMNPNFRRLVRAARGRGARVIDRCNLTVLFEPGQEDLIDFLVQERVEVVASMPCYSEANVDKQRGGGVFNKSIGGIRKLNESGYGRGTGLKLDLVYNPGGPFLPPPAKKLEGDYKKRLFDDFGLHFDELITITNMPIKRFRHDLQRSGRLADYNQLLLDSFNPATVEGLMCRSLISISWDGQLYDCDFNQMLEMPLQDGRRLGDLKSFSDLAGRPIVTAPHCFGCTAGAGSSCGGSID